MRDMANFSINIEISSNGHGFWCFKILKDVIRSYIVIRGTPNLYDCLKCFLDRKNVSNGRP